MNYKEIVSNILKDPRPTSALILFAAVILFLMSRCTPEQNIPLNTKGFPKGTILNIGYKLNGEIMVTTPEGKVLQRIEPNSFDSGALRTLSSISIAATRGSDSKVASTTSGNGFLEMIIPNAQAGHIPGYPNDIAEVATTIDGDYRCRRYNIVNYPPTAIFLSDC